MCPICLSKAIKLPCIQRANDIEYDNVEEDGLCRLVEGQILNTPGGTDLSAHNKPSGQFLGF